MTFKTTVLLMLMLTLLPVISAKEAALITIDPNKITGQVNPLVFGHNIVAANWPGKGQLKVYGRHGNGLWNPTLNVPVSEAVVLSKEMGMPILRYPGGCMTHVYDWKKTVGPLNERPDYTFGLMEFLSFCKAVGAEAQICVSAYTGEPQDAADLVEFLNAPAIKKLPWALKRAAWGHPEPYNVRFFEMGNESYHGNHGDYTGLPFKILTAEQYSNWFNTTVKIMKKISPDIKTGAVIFNNAPEWDAVVMSRTKDNADFMIDHFYAVGFADWNDEGDIVKKENYLMRSCMASSMRLQCWLDSINESIETHTGKKIPLAVSEYNASILNKGKPVPYRYTLGTALFCADSVRIFLEKKNNILLANYFSYFNGFWGTIHGSTDPDKQMDLEAWERNPAFHLFKLWRNHFGTKLNAITVKSPVKEFEGGYHTPPCHECATISKTDKPVPHLFRVTSPEKTTKQFAWNTEANGNIVLKLTGMTGSAYPQVGEFNASPGHTYRLSYEGKIADGEKGMGAVLGMGLVDSRGWNKTGSAVSAEGLAKAFEWTTIQSVPLITAPECKKILILFRLRCGKDPVTAKALIRNIKLEEIPNVLPPYPLITATSSISSDNKTVYLIVFNKDLKDSIKTEIKIKYFPAKTAKIWTVSGPPTGTNTNGRKDVGLKIDGGIIPVTADGFNYDFPPCSMNAIEIYRK